MSIGISMFQSAYNIRMTPTDCYPRSTPSELREPFPVTVDCALEPSEMATLRYVRCTKYVDSMKTLRLQLSV